MADKLDVKQGTLALMILKTIDVLGPLHGYGIARRIEETSKNRPALARIVGILTKNRADDEVREELQAHLEMETAENVRRGMPPDEARRKALLASGGITQAAESVRDRRGLPWIESLAADIRYALRTLRL